MNTRRHLSSITLALTLVLGITSACDVDDDGFDTELEQLDSESDEQFRSPAYWGEFSSTCSGWHERKYSAILWDIPWGASWEDTCWNTPATVNGEYRASPDDCVNTVLNMWGEFILEDAYCLSDVCQYVPSTDEVCCDYGPYFGWNCSPAS